LQQPDGINLHSSPSLQSPQGLAHSTVEQSTLPSLRRKDGPSALDLLAMMVLIRKGRSFMMVEIYEAIKFLW
jgi:hypothetical protein